MHCSVAVFLFRIPRNMHLFRVARSSHKPAAISIAAPTLRAKTCHDDNLARSRSYAPSYAVHGISVTRLGRAVTSTDSTVEQAQKNECQTLPEA